MRLFKIGQTLLDVKKIKAFCRKGRKGRKKVILVTTACNATAVPQIIPGDINRKRLAETCRKPIRGHMHCHNKLYPCNDALP